MSENFRIGGRHLDFFEFCTKFGRPKIRETRLWIVCKIPLWSSQDLLQGIDCQPRLGIATPTVSPQAYNIR